MNEQKLIDWLKVAFSYGVGSATMLKLIRHFGSVEEIFLARKADLANVAGKGVAENILSNNSCLAVDKALNWRNMCPERRFLITLDSEEYPQELAQIVNPPLVLFAEGNKKLLANKKIALVGTRHPTTQGAENARLFAKELANNSYTVVSGLAAGIDRYAHEGALEGDSSTIAVIGTGIDLVYPAANRELFKAISHNGLVLSEFQLGVSALSSNFPRRNRIIVGLSQACLVVESAHDGGSMISANFALEMGREVMAIPGSIHNPMARGCHKLIKQGAKLVETVADIIEDIQLSTGDTSQLQNSVRSVNDPVLEAMGFEPISVDNLCAVLKYDFSELCGKLLELEMSGQITNCGGGRYQRIFK